MAARGPWSPLAATAADHVGRLSLPRRVGLGVVLLASGSLAAHTGAFLWVALFNPPIHLTLPPPSVPVTVEFLQVDPSESAPPPAQPMPQPATIPPPPPIRTAAQPRPAIPRPTVRRVAASRSVTVPAQQATSTPPPDAPTPLSAAEQERWRDFLATPTATPATVTNPFIPPVIAASAVPPRTVYTSNPPPPASEPVATPIPAPPAPLQPAPVAATPPQSAPEPLFRPVPAMTPTPVFSPPPPTSPPPSMAPPIVAPSVFAPIVPPALRSPNPSPDLAGLAASPGMTSGPPPSRSSLMQPAAAAVPPLAPATASVTAPATLQASARSQILPPAGAPQGSNRSASQSAAQGAAGPAASAGNGRPGGTMESYNRELLAWLRRHERYPEEARRHGQEGTVVVRVVIESDGQVSDLAVVQSSGIAPLDTAAMETWSRDRPPPLPEGIPRAILRLPVHFRLDGIW